MKKFIILALFIASSMPLGAKIPLPAFKDITNVFYEENRHYSPILGEAILDSGLINNLRFLNISYAFNEKGERH